MNAALMCCKSEIDSNMILPYFDFIEFFLCIIWKQYFQTAGLAYIKVGSRECKL